MARRFEAVEELLDDALELPVEGKVYRIPSPSSEDGIRVQKIVEAAERLYEGGEDAETEVLDDDEEVNVIRLCLGPVEDELIADGVSWAWRRHVGLTAMFWIANGPEFAERYWTAAGDPSRLAPNRAARRKSSGSAAASKTRSRGSTSGTSARKATASGQRAAKTSHGAPSSPSGS